jgi:predicted ATP-grasp superfamily ATP-dependent carboligase
MATVLLTNAQLRKTLAAVRSLGKRGFQTIVVEETRFSPAAYSKYCTKALVCPNAHKRPDEFFTYIQRIIKEYKCDAFFPMDEDTVTVAIKYRDELSKICRLPLPPTESCELALDKGKILKHALRTGVAHPKTVHPESLESLHEITAELEYPVLIKPLKSNGGRGIIEVEKKEELVESYKKVYKNYPFPIIQEHLGKGDVYDVSLLYNQKSELKASFIMKHVRLFPLELGVSTVQESVYCPEMLQMAMDFMKGLNWYGIADLEFMINHDTGKITFLEINPKFWNSLHIGVMAGVDFPYLLYQIAMGEDVQEVNTYTTGLRFRNLLPGDILHYIANKNRKDMDPPFWSTKYDDNDDIYSKDDPLPVLGFILACLRYLFDIKMWRFLLRI